MDGAVGWSEPSRRAWPPPLTRVSAAVRSGLSTAADTPSGDGPHGPNHRYHEWKQRSLPHRARGVGASCSTGSSAGVFRHPVGALLQALTGFFPQRNAPPRGGALGAAVSWRRDDISCGGGFWARPQNPWSREGLNLTPRRTDNADADLCLYQPLIPMMFLSPRVMFVPLSGGRLATRSSYVKS